MNRLAGLLVLFLASGVLAPAAPDQKLPRVLFYTDPRESDNQIIRRRAPDQLSTAERYFAEYASGVLDATITQDPTQVSREKLVQYQAVVFFTAIKPPIDRAGLVKWVKNGGAFTGIHSTANTFQDYAPFGEMLGAAYESRPWRTPERPLVPVRIQVADRGHPATKHLGETFEITDDIYLFKKWEPSKAHLLLSLDPRSLDLTKVRSPEREYPIAWTKPYGKGRMFYTALGDDEAVWKDPRYRSHLLGGIRWTMAATRRREVAVTFDDLPAVNLWEAAAVKQMTQKLLRSISTHRVPSTGFVTESRLTRNGQIDPVLVAALKLWLEAGLELGNHSYSHFDLNSTPPGTYQADIIRGEAITRRLLQPKGRKLRYFRHPYLHTGSTRETRTTVEQFLTRRGYQVAPVTIDNQDWVFAAAYSAARQRGDVRTMKRIVQAYPPYMERMFQFFEQMSVDVLGYEVKQVLLLHASPLNADTFDQLVAMMKRRGYRFIRLEQALQDPAYRLPDHYTGLQGLSWLHRWAVTKGLPRRAEPREPEWLQQQLRSMGRR